MRLSFRLIATAAATAMTIAGTAPAMARPGPWGGYGGYGHGDYGYGGRGWHRRGGGVSFGDVALGAVIIGGVAVAANGIANGSLGGNRGDRDDDRPYDDGGRGRIEDDRGGPGPAAQADRGYRQSRGDAQEDAAVDRCSAAAEQQAGAGARIDGIRHVGRDGAGWRVDGDVTEARGYGQSFVCGASDARVDFVQLSDRMAAR